GVVVGAIWIGAQGAERAGLKRRAGGAQYGNAQIFTRCVIPSPVATSSTTERWRPYRSCSVTPPSADPALRSIVAANRVRGGRSSRREIVSATQNPRERVGQKESVGVAPDGTICRLMAGARRGHAGNHGLRRYCQHCNRLCAKRNTNGQDSAAT